MERFYEQLLEYGKNGLSPLHMPGHKRNVNLFSLDITEIDGFDDLHYPQGVLRKAMEHAARVYGSQHTYFLVNGSTGGILAAISSLIEKGDTVLMARNCHISVYNGVCIREANPLYVYPEGIRGYGMWGAVSPGEIERILEENGNVKCVVITSPTYEGVVSDVEAIADIVHKRGVPLIVDEAHGAHFGFHEAFPASSVTKNADLVIHSVHKTLPAFTQSALIHINGDLASKEKLERYLSIYQSSSPSYLLMYGIDRCMWFLEEEGERAFRGYVERLEALYKRLEGLNHLKLLHNVKGVGKDCSKIVISTRGTSMNGKELFRILKEEHRFHLEMAALDYVIAMTGLCDGKGELERFAEALLKIDEKVKSVEDGAFMELDYARPPVRMKPSETERSKGVACRLRDCVGKVTKEMIHVYPPGIPLLVPGEEVTKECVDRLGRYQKEGFELRGWKDSKRDWLEVVAEAPGY